MLLRLVGWWLATALLALAVSTALGRQEHARLAVRFADLAAGAVATDWAQGFEPAIEPNRPIDAMPGLPVLIAPLLDPDLGVVVAGLALPSGRIVAARGSRETLKRLAEVAAAQADASGGDPWRNAGRSSTQRRAPAAVALDDTTRLLIVPLRDWTGTVRASLNLLYEVDVEVAGSLWPWSWIDFAGTLVVGGLLLAVLGRSGWRSIDPLEQAWLPALLVFALIIAIGAISGDQDDGVVTDRALSGIARRLSTPTFRWSADALQATPVPLGDRIRRVARDVPGFDAITIEAAPASARSKARGTVAPKLVVTARNAGWRTGWRSILRIGLVALVTGLTLWGVLPTLLPRRWQRKPHGRSLRRPDCLDPGGFREAGRACLYLITLAVSASWPALMSAEPLFAARGASTCGAVEGLAALLGAAVGHRIEVRHGWRFAALPGAVLGVAGAAGLGAFQAGIPGFLSWAALGFGSGLAARSVALWAGRRTGAARPVQRGGEPLPWALGGLAGVALGLLIVLTANLGVAATVLTLLWSCVVLALAVRKNDAAAPLRHAVAAPPQGFRQTRAARLLPMVPRLRLALRSGRRVSDA